MKPSFHSLLNYFQAHPSKLLLTDGIGALLSAFWLGIILTTFEPYFKMPTKILFFLAVIACVFAVYSISCHFFAPKNWRPYLKIIVIANGTYCFLTLACVLYFYQQITTLALTYFLLEMALIILLIFIEKTTLKNAF